MSPSTSVEQVLDLARALYERGAIPEALAIAREVFVSVADRDDVLTLLSTWTRSLGSGAPEPGAPAERAAANAIDWLEPALDLQGGIRALTNICLMHPSASVSLTERSQWTRQRKPVKRRRFGFNVESPGLGWEITSPVLVAARRYRIVMPDNFAAQVERWLLKREPVHLSATQIKLVNSYARDIRSVHEGEPALRLALTSAVTSGEPGLIVARVIEIVRPDEQVRAAANLFTTRGYPTEGISVVVDTLADRPDAGAAEKEELWTQAKRGFGPGLRFEPTTARAKPPMPSPPGPIPPAPAGAPPGEPLAPSEPGPAPDKSFFFLLKGEQAYKNQVVRGEPVDLHFLYDFPSVDALAKLKGQGISDISAAARKGKPLEIGVFVKPVGLMLRDDENNYKIARIANDELEEPVFFMLQALKNPASKTGVSVVLTYNGAEVFQAFIGISIVDAIDKASSRIPDLAISNATFDTNAIPRDLTAFITTSVDDGLCRVSVRVGKNLPKKPKVLADPAKLKTSIDSTRASLTGVANYGVFGSLEPGRWGPGPGQEPDFTGATCKMMSAGSKLYKFLAGTLATQELVEAIDALDAGSKISIFTDTAFVPWEIVFPRYFPNTSDRVPAEKVPAEYEPSLLWGNRFEFETVLLFSDPSENVQNPLPPDRRQPGTLNMRIGIGSTVEAPDPAGSAASKSLNAIEHHRAYCAQHDKVAHWLDGSDEIRKAFESADYAVSMLYLMCHGSSDGADEQLDFGMYKPDPQGLTPSAYPGWPVVFINSCSIGAISPHLFDTFLQRFREKHAFGVIASSFPLPTRFATLYGCEFLDAYRSGTRVGQILFDLRQRLLKETNPLGFFYALQCPLDIQCPEGS